jgi:putative transposase
MQNGRSHSQPGSVYRQRILRLYPNRVQASALARACGTRRWAYNWALEQQKEAYAATGKFLGPAEQMRSIVRLKRTAEYAWLQQVSKCAPEAAIQDLHQALMVYLLKRNASRGPRLGFPRFKKRGDSRESVRLHGSIAIVGGSISLPRIGKVRIRPRSLDCLGRICSVTCFQEAGNWYVSLRLERRTPAPTPSAPCGKGELIGIDLGLKNLAVDSNGKRYQGARALARSQRRLARAARALSRKQKGSKNRGKARGHLARTHARVRRQRADFLHKITSRLAKSKQAVVIEDLALGGMLKSRRFSRGLADQALGSLRRQLEYKCPASGCRLLVAPRYFPSSKRCSNCGWTWVGMPLSAREFGCPECGLRRDRDHNAALNLKRWAQQLLAAEVAAGRAETLNAWGARVRPGRSAGAEQLPKAGWAQAVKQESSTAGLPTGQSRTTNLRGGS